MAVHLAVFGGVFGGVFLCAVLFSHEMSLMRSGIELSQFLRIFQPTFTFFESVKNRNKNGLLITCSDYEDTYLEFFLCVRKF